MKRNQFIKHMELHGCELVREGKRHSWWWNPTMNIRSSIPRHTELNENLAKKICKDLGIPTISIFNLTNSAVALWITEPMTTMTT